MKRNFRFSNIFKPKKIVFFSFLLKENVGGTIYFYPTANHTTSQNTSAVAVGVGVVPSGVVDPGVGVSVGMTPIAPVQPSILYTSHVYPGPASNVISMQPKTQLESAFFVPDEMRAEILARNVISNLILDANEAAQHDLPLQVDNYNSLYPLETLPVQPLHAKLTLPSSTYKATHSTSGVKYCLRRLHGKWPNTTRWTRSFSFLIQKSKNKIY